jgi:hypothetical protein
MLENYTYRLEYDHLTHVSSGGVLFMMHYFLTAFVDPGGQKKLLSSVSHEVKIITFVLLTPFFSQGAS